MGETPLRRQTRAYARYLRASLNGTPLKGFTGFGFLSDSPRAILKARDSHDSEIRL